MNKNKIMYRLHKALFSEITDSFLFRVSVPGVQTIVHEFSVKYVQIFRSHKSHPAVIIMDLSRDVCAASTLVQRPCLCKER